MKEMWDKLSAFVAPWWWVILVAAVVIFIIMAIVIKAKNIRIKKLKKQLKATRTELETAQSRESVIVRSRAVNGTQTTEPAQPTPVVQEVPTVEITGDYTAEPQPTQAVTEENDGDIQSIYTVTKAQDDSPEPEYYATQAVVAPTSGNVKFTVVYDRPKDTWVIKKDGVNRVVRRVDTKEEAMQIARELCRKYNAKLIVHKKDGKFQKH